MAIKRGPSRVADSLTGAMEIAQDFLVKAAVPKPPGKVEPVGYAIKRKKVDVWVDDPASSVTVTPAATTKKRFKTASAE